MDALSGDTLGSQTLCRTNFRAGAYSGSSAQNDKAGPPRCERSVVNVLGIGSVAIREDLDIIGGGLVVWHRTKHGTDAIAYVGNYWRSIIAAQFVPEIASLGPASNRQAIPFGATWPTRSRGPRPLEAEHLQRRQDGECQSGPRVHHKMHENAEDCGHQKTS